MPETSNKTVKKLRAAPDQKSPADPPDAGNPDSDKAGLTVANLLPPVAKAESLPLEIHLPGATPDESVVKQDAAGASGAGLPEAAPLAAGIPPLVVKAAVTLLPLSSPDRQAPIDDLTFAARLVERLTVPETAKGVALPADPAAPPAEAAAPKAADPNALALQKPTSGSGDAVLQTAASVKPIPETTSAGVTNVSPAAEAAPEKTAPSIMGMHQTSDKRHENDASPRDQDGSGKDNSTHVPHGETGASVSPLGPRYSEAAIAAPAAASREFAPSHATKEVTQGTALEPVQPEAAAERVSGQARDISVRLSNQNQENVNLRVVERNGELHVAVRAADAGLTNTLRNNLSELSARLDHSGFQTEMWTPASAESSLADPKSKQGSDGKDHPQGRGSGEHAGDGREQKQRDQQQPRWVEELENSFGNRRKP